LPKSSAGAFCLQPAYIEYIHDQFVSVVFPDAEEPVKPEEYRDRGLIASAAARPFQTGFGTSVHPTVCGKAAAPFHSLVCNHAFVNANKRTAVVALDLFLYANNRLLLLDDDTEMYDLAKNTASYRSRGTTHEACLAEILGTIRAGSIHFNRLRGLGALPSFIRMRAGVRGHPLNLPAANR
jgi:death on curing protein